MHELGIVIEIVKQVEEYKVKNNLKDVKKLVLQIGELSGVVPKYIEDVYPIAIEKTDLSNMKLAIEITPGLGKCFECDFTFNLVHNDNTCPICGCKEWEVITGRDLMIKEIHGI